MKEDEAPLVPIIFDLYAGRSRHQRSMGSPVLSTLVED